MPCLIKTISASKMLREKKQQLQKSKNKSFTSKIQYLILKAPGNNVTLQLDKILLTTQI